MIVVFICLKRKYFICLFFAQISTNWMRYEERINYIAYSPLKIQNSKLTMQFLALPLIYIIEEFPFRSSSIENDFNIIYIYIYITV